MAQLRRHNPILEKRLQVHVTDGNAEALLDVLGGLSNADFRTAGYLLREKLLPEPQVAPQLWHLLLGVVPADSKAYLGTFLKPLSAQIAAGHINFDFDTLSAFAAHCTPLDSRKTLEALLPMAGHPDEVRRLLQLFTPEDDNLRIAVLLQAATAPACYELFRLLRRLEHKPAELRRYCLLLMQRGTKYAFNMAGILQKYFDLDELPGSFSIHIESYHLGRLDESYEKFLSILGN